MLFFPPREGEHDGELFTGTHGWSPFDLHAGISRGPERSRVNRVQNLPADGLGQAVGRMAAAQGAGRRVAG